MSTLDFIPRAVKKRKVDPSSSKPAQAESSETSKGTIANSDSDMGKRPIPPSRPVVHLPDGSQLSGNESRQWPMFQTKRAQSIRDNGGFPELAILVWLALSDYAIWSDEGLRRRLRLEGGTDVAQVKQEFPAEGDSLDLEYLSLCELFEQSPIFRLVSPYPRFDQSEVTYANNTRAFGQDLFDIRFIVDPDASSATRSLVNRRYNARSQESIYEVRRKFGFSWDAKFGQVSEKDWDELTLYIENIPAEYRKLPEIAKLLILLLPALLKPGQEMTRIQRIYLPPHHQDGPDDIPHCKGFALVTFSRKEDVEYFLNRWPWEKPKPAPLKVPGPSDRRRNQASNSSDQSTSDETKPKKEKEPRRGRSGRPEADLARYVGLRVCTKVRWEELRQEYLDYRQRLAEELVGEQDQELRVKAEPRDDSIDLTAPLTGTGPSDNYNSGQSSIKREEQVIKTDPVDEPSALKRPREEDFSEAIVRLGYPVGCVIFVRNLHYATNRTTLKKLFTRPWSFPNEEITIAYVDYAKNMEACYVRCFLPDHTQQFCDYFSSRHIIQENGLDGEGTEIPSSAATSVSDDRRPISAEIISGQREEIYWEKHPEKIRRQVVDQTLQALGMGTSVNTANSTSGHHDGEHRKRKRARQQAPLRDYVVS